MPKRKRRSQDEDENASAHFLDRALQIRKSRLQAKIEQGSRSLTRALKLARSFERQKLGRRQKAAEDDGKELLRLKEEIICLKSLDLAQTATRYLVKQLVKTKRTKESPAFRSLYGEGHSVDAPQQGATANVVGRLFNSNPLKEVLPGVMGAIYGALGLDMGGKAKTATVERKTAPGTEQPNLRSSKLSGVDDGGPVAMSNKSHDTIRDPGEVDYDDDSEDDLSRYRDRLASSSPSSFGQSSESETSHAKSDAPGGNEPAPTRAAGLSQSLSPSTSTSPPPLTQSKKSKPPAPRNLTTTTFLPSLTMGGYYSGSESGGEGDDPYLDHAGAGARQLRRNRRGQRARQQIAEKKYGSKAKHLKNRPIAVKNGRDSGWDVKRGATNATADTGSGRQKGFGAPVSRRGRPARTTGPTGANGEAVDTRKRSGAQIHAKHEGGSLHPSWEAAKRRKEQSQKISGSSMGSGKKTVFVD